MLSAIEELDRVAELCARLDLSVPEEDWSSHVLTPIAALIGAETASMRRFGVANGVPVPLSVVDMAVPGSVREAYLDRYFRLDPIRRLLPRRLVQPLFADPVRRGEWSRENAEPGQRAGYREDFRRYRREFLLPNHFYHHLGFCLQDSSGGTIALDFHRPGRMRQFGALEGARARLVAGYLQAKAGQAKTGQAKAGSNRSAPPLSGAEPSAALTPRESQVAEAVAIGLSNKQVAQSLGISARTVENHLRAIFAKYGVATRTGLAARLRERQLTHGPP